MAGGVRFGLLLWCGSWYRRALLLWRARARLREAQILESGRSLDGSCLRLAVYCVPQQNQKGRLERSLSEPGSVLQRRAKSMTAGSNHPAAGKARIPRLLQIERLCPGLPEPERYV